MMSWSQVTGAGRAASRRQSICHPVPSQVGTSSCAFRSQKTWDARTTASLATSAHVRRRLQHITSTQQVRSTSNQAALRQSAPARAEAVETSHPSVASNGHDTVFKGQWGFARPGRTRLPTPLPPEVKERRTVALRNRLGLRSKLRTNQSASDANSSLAFGDLTLATLNAINTDASYYTPSHVKENVAMLRACLSTGLIARASKIFDEARASMNEHRHSPSSSVTDHRHGGALGMDMYNAMIAAYMRKAWQEEDDRQSTVWVQRAWTLFDDMNRPNDTMRITSSSADPRPNSTTYAIMAKGIVRLMRSSRYSAKNPGLNALLANMRQNSIRVQEVIISPTFSQQQGELMDIASSSFSREGEPDARPVLQQLISAAADLADSAMSAELHDTHRLLSRLEHQADTEVRRAIAGEQADGKSFSNEREELIPVRAVPKPKTLLKQSFAPDPEIAFNLQVLRENLSIVEQAKIASADPYERQKWLEFSAMEAARKRFDHMAENMEQMGLQNASLMRTKRVQTMMWEWYGKLEKVLTEDIEKLRKEVLVSQDAYSDTSRQTNSTKLVHSIFPFLKLVPPKKLALLTVLEMTRLQGTGGVVGGMKTAQALVSVGKLVEAEAYASQLKDQDDYFTSAKHLQDELRKSQLSDFKARGRLRMLLQRQKGEKGNAADLPSWTSNVSARVGSFLVQRLMNVAKIRRKAVDRDNVEWDEEQPVFYSAYQYIQGRRLGVIKINDEVASELNKNPSSGDMLQLRLLPMLVPPKPWVTHESGGYYSVKSRALRYKEVVEQSTYLRHASEKGDLDVILTGLDILGNTAWSINEEVFAVMTKVWNSGKAIGKLPPIALHEKEPEKPAEYDTDIGARGAYLRRMKMHGLRKAAAHSQRCDANYKLEVARAYAGERFYFPHNMDFRGRAYPIPPTLNHIGDDMCRGLLRFADAKPLGVSGLRWLRIHVANVYGFDKASFSEREAFAIEHIDSIRASVRDPLGENGGWWLRADDPWQCLAACIELTNALDHPDGPEKFESRLPVHQDGTCNGLQHYAALGGDLAGAKQVNLSSGDRPSDVYTGVADMVVKVVNEDAAKGDPLAQQLVGKITRKVVKQTVMTTVYGVTYIGAKEQVSRQLAARGDIDSEQLWQVASYLATKIMGCIGDLFKGADAIKSWLTGSALLIAKSIPKNRVEELGSQAKGAISSKLISKEQMTSVIWTTPLGLPVVQPYRKMVRKQVSTVMQTVYLHDPQTATQVSSQKQSTAFPPNFIHSLDATHMFLTAIECQNANLTFASVHDSYWTHACDVAKMNDAIRDTFIQLHTCEILKRLRDEFLERYADFVVPIQEARRILKKREKQKVKSNDENIVEDDSIATTAKTEGAFVPLADLLPPIPERGTFNVQEIRSSLYFFS